MIRARPPRDVRLWIGAAVVALLALARVAAAFLEANPVGDLSSRFGPPAPGHPLGFDHQGRDVALRLVDGVESFFFPGLAAAAVAVVTGTALGAMVAYPRSPWLVVPTRFSLTLISALPRLVAVVVVLSLWVSALDAPGEHPVARLYLLALLVGLTSAPQVAEAVAERVARFRVEEFIEAARAHGLSHARILGRHILLANCRPLLAREACFAFATFLLVETSLSYLGDYGVPDRYASWGNLLAGMRTQVLYGLPPGVVAPAASIGASMIGLTLLGQALGDRGAAR